MEVVYNNQKLIIAIKNISFYIVYELQTSNSNLSDPTLQNCLFGSVTLNKNVYIRKERFSFPGGGFGQNVIIFRADMSSSTHIDNKGKDILVLGKGPMQGLGEDSLTAEKM